MKPRLAVFELHHLGDAVLSLPFLRGAKDKFHPVVCCRPNVRDFLAAAAPDLETLALPDGWTARWLHVRRHLRLGRREAAACVWPDPRAHALMLATGAGIRAGFAVNARNFYAPRNPHRARRLAAGELLAPVLDILAGGHALTPPLLKSSPSQHHLESWKQLAESLGFSCDTRPPWISAPDIPRGRQSLHFIVHAGGRLPGKRWPVERFEALLREVFARRDWLVSIVRVPGEPCPEPAALGQRVVEVRNYEEMIRLFQGADAVVCNDSFPGHLAAALGKPVVAIFGPGEPAWFAPYGSAKYAVVSNACPHRPCLDHCVMPSFVCQEGITVEAVRSAIDRAARDLCQGPGRGKK